MARWYFQDKALIIRTSWLTFNTYARSWGLFACIPEDGSEALVQHELQHCKDWRAHPFSYSFWYLFNWKHRVWAELRGYSHNKRSNSGVARVMNKFYFLPITLDYKDVSVLMDVCLNNSYKNSKDRIKGRFPGVEGWVKRMMKKINRG